MSCHEETSADRQTLDSLQSAEPRPHADGRAGALYVTFLPSEPQRFQDSWSAWKDVGAVGVRGCLALPVDSYTRPEAFAPSEI